MTSSEQHLNTFLGNRNIAYLVRQLSSGTAFFATKWTELCGGG
jgi:hypothetical protein